MSNTPTFAELSAKYGPEEANRRVQIARAARAVRHRQIASEIAALGFADVANIAASSLLTFSRDPSFGLSDMDDQLTAAKARKAIQAYQAAQARVAA